MAHIVKLADIKEITWELVLHYLENYQRGYENKIFYKDYGKNYIANLLQNKEINKFQWKAIAGQEFNLLPVFLKHFLGSHFLFNIPTIEKYIKKDVFSEEFIKSPKLKEFFEAQYEKLERKILLSNQFEYKLLIPVFRLTLSDELENLPLDDEKNT